MYHVTLRYIVNEFEHILRRSHCPFERTALLTVSATTFAADTRREKRQKG